MRIAILALAALVATGGALGQGAIEKCVGADGKITYSDSGCAQGSSVAGYVERERSKAEAAAARRAANDRARRQEFARRRAKAAAKDDAVTGTARREKSQ